MGISAILFLIYTILNIGQQWYTGYLYESLAFYQRVARGYYLWILVGKAIVFIIPVLNLLSKNKEKLCLQLFINGLMIGYLIARYILSDFSMSIIPGWHTTIYSTLSIYSLLTAIGLFLIIDFLGVRLVHQR